MKIRLATSLLACVVCGCGEAQIGTSKETFKTVDALYTAVGLRDAGLVKQCEDRLKTLRETEKLPSDAAQTLESIIVMANAGTWEPAQERLSRFMEGQYR